MTSTNHNPVMPGNAPAGSARIRGGVLVLVAALLWGTIGPAQSLLGPALAPGAVAGWRHVLGGSVLCALALAEPRGFRRLITWPVWGWCVLAGVVSAAYQMTFATSIALTGAAMGSVVSVATVPLFTGIVARVWDRQPLGRGWLVGSAAAVMGCVVLLVPLSGSRVDPVGLACGVGAGALFAMFTVTAKKVATSGVPLHLGTGVSLLVGGVLLTPFMVAGQQALNSQRVVLVISWLGVITTAVAYVLYGRGLRSVSMNVAGTLSLAEPLTAALLSTLLLRERLSGMQWLACAVILAGLFLAGRAPKSSPPITDGLWRVTGVVPMPVGVAVRPEQVGHRHTAARAAVRRSANAEGSGSHREVPSALRWGNNGYLWSGVTLFVAASEAGSFEAHAPGADASRMGHE